MLFIVCPTPSLDCFASATPSGLLVYSQTAGGSGIRVGRTLQQWDTKVQIIAPLGGFNGYHVRRLLKAEGLPTRTLMGPIPTQQTCYIQTHDKGMITQEIQFAGHNPQGFANFTKTLIPYFKKAKTLLFCGPLPTHFPEDSYANWIRMAQTENPDMAIYMSASGKTMRTTLTDTTIRLTGITLSRSEWEAWTGLDFSKQTFAQHSATTASHITHTVVIDGENPVISHHQGHYYRCTPPTFADEIPGGSIKNEHPHEIFMAGFVWGLAHQKLSPEAALQAGTLAAAHHCFGKQLSQRDLRKNLNMVEVLPL